MTQSSYTYHVKYNDVLYIYIWYLCTYSMLFMIFCVYIFIHMIYLCKSKLDNYNCFCLYVVLNHVRYTTYIYIIYVHLITLLIIQQTSTNTMYERILNTFTYIFSIFYTCMHASVHTSIPPYLHTYLPTYLHTYVHTYIHPSMHACMHTYIHVYSHMFI